MRRAVNGCLGGRRYGNLVSSDTGALWIRPPHRRMPSLSRKSRSCFTSVGCFVRCGVSVRLESSFQYLSFWQSLIHAFLAVPSSVDVIGPVCLLPGLCKL